MSEIIAAHAAVGGHYFRDFFLPVNPACGEDVAGKAVAFEVRNPLGYLIEIEHVLAGDERQMIAGQHRDHIQCLDDLKNHAGFILDRVIGQRLFTAFTAISYKRTDNSAVGGTVAGQEDVSAVRDRDADELVRVQPFLFDKEV